MNKKELHEVLEKNLTDIENVMELIRPNAKDISADSKTLIKVYIQQKLNNVYERLKIDIIADFKKLVGEQE